MNPKRLFHIWVSYGIVHSKLIILPHYLNWEQVTLLERLQWMYNFQSIWSPWNLTVSTGSITFSSIRRTGLEINLAWWVWKYKQEVLSVFRNKLLLENYETNCDVFLSILSWIVGDFIIPFVSSAYKISLASVIWSELRQPKFKFRYKINIILDTLDRLKLLANPKHTFRQILRSAIVFQRVKVRVTVNFY